jgi:hypothetical protein
MNLCIRISQGYLSLPFHACGLPFLEMYTYTQSAICDKKATNEDCSRQGIGLFVLFSPFFPLQWPGLDRELDKVSQNLPKDSILP